MKAPPLARLGRWLLLGGLGLLIFWLGTASDSIFAWLTHGWQALARTTGQEQVLRRLQQETSHQVTTRSVPAMLTYGLLYVAACLALLRVALASARQWWLAVGLYVLSGLLCATLVLVGKLAGGVDLLYRAGRQLIEFIVSPLPMILALVLLLPGLRRSASQPGQEARKAD